ncbi:pepQ protein [Lapidilactobacillus concavus DSM 17758]|uniref:PepQ protein n=1 Tax=Lapidilactobacillus concavus DSM 17758 TaxID=1423735 RepID=A0A0R1W6S7_9LACO|nr:Xaa-Pro peptidase family protein [Lapidilactobacillus concavus]KRM10268.1 pepQ protein [Lapidilactobacillus concavus DSM 17758]GEL13763.1 dipeptidase [Lapidilactobacillus concavus]
MTKLESLQNWVQAQHLDVVYISDPNSVGYFTNFISDPHERILGLFVFADAEPFLFAPELSVGSAQKAGWSGEIHGYLDHQHPFAMIADLIKARTSHYAKWGLEKDSLPVQRFEAVRAEFPDATFPGNVSRFVEHMKLFKTPEEIKLMEEAGEEADLAFSIGFNAIQEGRTEQEVVAEIEYGLMKQGIMEMSFDTIVQAGANAANPHGGPEKNAIEPNQLILFDLGTAHHGYMSDASRTVAFGQLSDKQRDIYDVCLEAQLAAQDAVKPGLTAAELDKIARDIITKAGYGEYFIHRLGHGIGTSTHEFPSIMEGNEMVLEPGMCFSIEPGIYIPGFAGVRIEDCVHVTEDGCKAFTHTNKKLNHIPVH